MDSSRLASASLAAVGHGGNFLGRRSTREAFNGGEVYVSEFDTRDSYEAWSASGKPSLLEELQELVQETLDEYEPLPLDEDIERKLAAIEERARQGMQATQPKG